MDLSEESNVITRKCYKFKNQLFDNLKINYNASNSMIALWNKYQIFIFEDVNFESSSKIIVPEFQVHQVIISNNHLICLDTSCNVHITSLKFKNAAQKRFKGSFQSKKEGILVFAQIEDNVISIQYSNSYYLCINKINSDYQLEKKFELNYSGHWPLPEPKQEKSLLTSHKLSNEETSYVINLFDNVTPPTNNDTWLIIFSLDSLSVFSCMYKSKTSESDSYVKKLYTCPSEICNIDIKSHDGTLYVLVGLKIGSVIRLSLKNVSNKPEVIHLNTALHKYITFKDEIIYTDGKSMWKVQNTFRDTIAFSKCFPRQIKDFIKIGDLIVCTSYMNILYVFSLYDESSYLNRQSIEEYCTAEKLLNNSDYLYKIIEEVEINNELASRINEEGNYITAFSLSKRQDIMDTVINATATVYDTYKDALKEHTEINLTEHLHEYFKLSSFFVFINISTTSLHHIFNNILANILNSLKIHITFATDNNILKTTSLKLARTFRKMNILIPLNIKEEEISEIALNIKLVCSVPGALEEKQKLWVTLYRKQVLLNSEHLIKPSVSVNKNVSSLKEPTEHLSIQVYKTTMSQYGNMFKILNATSHYADEIEFSTFCKLPNEYKELLRNDRILKNMESWSQRKAFYVYQQLSGESFLKSESCIYFEVGNITVRMEIIYDEFTNPVLKVSSMNMRVAFHIRNFISKLIYKDFLNHGTEFIKYSIYNITENIQREIKNYLLKHQPFEKFQLLGKHFERYVHGALP